MTRFVPISAVLTILLVISSQSSAKTRVLFLGFSGEGAPAIEQTFDRMLRDRITALPEIATCSFDESQRYRRILDIDRSKPVSEGQLNSLENILPDSVLIIWTQVKKLSLAPLRKNIIRVDIQGELQTGLTVYDLSRKNFSYCGRIESKADKRTGYILFSPIGLETISPADREALIGELIENAVDGCTNIIESLHRNEQMEPQKIVPGTDSANNRSPSISDVFNVPSVEAAEIFGKPASPKPEPKGGVKPAPVKTGK